MRDLEKEVVGAMALDHNYPLGETDAMKWAIAWRLTRDRKEIDANATAEDVDGWMVGWFANAMASASEAVKMRRDEDAWPEVKSVLRHAHDEIVTLRRHIDALSPKAEAYDAMIAIINRLAPMQHSGSGVDVAWRIKQIIEPKE